MNTSEKILFERMQLVFELVREHNWDITSYRAYSWGFFLEEGHTSNTYLYFSPQWNEHDTKIIGFDIELRINGYKNTDYGGRINVKINKFFNRNRWDQVFIREVLIPKMTKCKQEEAFETKLKAAVERLEKK